MKAVRWIFAILLSLPLFFVVFFGIFLGGVSTYASDPENVKSSLAESGLYDNAGSMLSSIIPSMIGFEEGSEENEALQDALEDENSNINVSVEALLDSQLLQSEAETAVDAFYAWFRGDTEYPIMDIDFIDDDEALASFLVEIMVIRVESLSVCSSDYVMPEGTSPYDMECRPADLDTNELRDSLYEEMEASSDEDIEEMSEGFAFKTEPASYTAEMTSQAQLIYGLVDWLPWILIVLGIIAFLIVYLLVPGQTAKRIYTGIILFLSSIPLALSKSLLVQQFENISSTTLSGGTGDVILTSFDEGLMEIYEVLFTDIFSKVSTIAFLVAILGVGLIVWGVVLKHKGEEVPEKTEKESKTKKEKKD